MLTNWDAVQSRLLPGEYVVDFRGDQEGDTAFACWTNTRVFMRAPDGWVDAVHRDPDWYVPFEDEGGG